MAQAGLGQDAAPAPLTMSERYSIANSMRRQGASDDEILATLGDYTILPKSAGLGDDVVEDDTMGFGELLLNYGPRTALGGALEGASGIAEDYMGGGTLSDALDAAADFVGPSDDQEERRAARAEENAGFLPTVGDAITQEAATLGGTIGAGMLAGSVVPGAGTIVGGILGAGLGMLRMYDQGRDNVIRGKVAAQLGKAPDEVTEEEIANTNVGPLTDDEKRRVGAVGTLGLVDAFPASKIVGMLQPGKVAGIAERSILKASGEGGLKVGAQEGAMEFGQELGTMLLTDEQLRQDIAKLPEDEIMVLAEHIAQTKGRELAISFLAGFGLGGGAGTVAGGAQQNSANAYARQRVTEAAAIAESRGIPTDQLNDIAKDPEKVGTLQRGVTEVGNLQEIVNAWQQEYDTAPAEAKPMIAEELEKANRRLEAKIDETFGPKGLALEGFKDTATLNAEKKAARDRKRAAANDRLQELGIPKNEDLDPDTLYDAAEKLSTAAAEVQSAQERLESAATPKARVKAQKRLDDAIEVEAKARAEVPLDVPDAAAQRREAAEARAAEAQAVAEREQSLKKAADFDEKVAGFEAELASFEDPKERARVAKNWIKNNRKNPDKAINAQLKAERKKLEDARRSGLADPSELARMRGTIADLEGRLGTANPAVVAAERFLRGPEEQSAAQSQPQGGEAARQGDTATTGEAVQAAEEASPAPAATEAPPAAESDTGPAKPEPAPAATTISEDTGQRFLDAVGSKTRAEDPAAKLEAQQNIEQAAEDALTELGIPVVPETIRAFVKGPATQKITTRINRARRAAPEVTPEPTPAPTPEPTPEPVAVTGKMTPERREQIRAGFGPRQSPWQDLTDEVDVEAGIEANEASMRTLMETNDLEYGASYDADGNLLGFGTNNLYSGVGWPTTDWDTAATFTHSHPMRTPFSKADIEILRARPNLQAVRAVIKGANTIEVRARPALRAMDQRQFNSWYDANVIAPIKAAITAGTYPTGLSNEASGLLTQEAALRIMEAQGLIDYVTPIAGLSRTERDTINDIVFRSEELGTGDGRGSDGRSGAEAGGPGRLRPEQPEDGSVAAGTPQDDASPETAAGLDLARTADVEPEPGLPADMERVRDLTAPLFEASKVKGSKQSLHRVVNQGMLTPEGMDAGLRYAAHAVSTEGTEAATVVLQTARVMFPKAKLDPKTFVKEKVTTKNGKKVIELSLDDGWKLRINAAWQFLREVGQADGMGFTIEKLPFRQTNGFWEFEAQHFVLSDAMQDYLQISPPESAMFTRPMEDPDDTTDIVRNVLTNRFTPEAIDGMRGTAAALQQNVYYLDQQAIADLTVDDLISDKKLGEQLIKRNDEGVFVDKDGTPVDDLPLVQRTNGKKSFERRNPVTGETETIAPDQTYLDLDPKQKFLKTQRFRQAKKLAMLKRMAEAHGDQPIGYRYRVDDKGRIYADGAFTPQTGDYFKGVVRVGTPDGPILKDMPTIDHSASGWQMATLITRDADGAGWFNLGPQPGETTPLAEQAGYKKRDMYDQLMVDLRAQIEADAAAGNPLAVLFKQKVFDTGLPFGKVQIKPPVIAVNYAGGQANFLERLKDVYAEAFTGVPAADMAGIWGYASKTAYDQLRAKAPDTMRFQDWAIKNLAAVVEAVDGKRNPLTQKPTLQFTVGLEGTYAKLKPVEKAIKVKAVDGQESVEQTVDTPTSAVDAKATARSIYSQIIQGFDAAVLHRAIRLYKENGDDFVTSNHDSYTIPQGNAGRMAAATREAMKQIMQEAGDVPARLRAEIEAQAAAAGVTIEGLNDPQVFNEDGSFIYGSYNLDTIDASVPVFVENAGDIAPAYTDLQGNPMPSAPDAPAIARGIDYEASDTGELTGVRMDTSLPKAAQFAQDNRFQTGRDLKLALQERALSAQREQGVDLTKDTEENVERLADFVVEDAMAAVVNNRNAIGWYGRTVDRAKARLRELHPELKPGSDAEFQFSWALAVTSNGLKVDKNFQLAEQAYNEFKRTGKFPTNIGIGQAASAINDGLAYYQQLVDKLGSVQAAKEFMVKRQPVRDIERISGITVSKEGKGTILPGAVILGPKIAGGFFSNLYGNFNELTMDRWFTRTVGRWRGNLIGKNPKMEAKKRDEMKVVLRGLEPADLARIRALYDGSGIPVRKTMTNAQIDALAKETAKRSMDPAWRKQINALPRGENVRKIGNGLAKYLDGQIEDPGGANARNYLRKVFNRGLDRLRANPDMSELTMADLQALLWYPEKRLYDTAKKAEGEEVTGYEADETPDYATAADKLVRLRQAGRDGAVSGAGVAGAEPSFGPALADPGLAAGIDRTGYGSAAAGSGVRPGSTPDGQGNRNDGRSGVSPAGVSPDARLTDPATYSAAMDAAAANLGPAAAQVSRVPNDANVQRVLLDDGATGYALDGDNIIGVFSDPARAPQGAAQRVLEDAVARGGRRLDGFDTFLPKIYARSGFRAVARLPFSREFAPSTVSEYPALADWDYEAMSPWNGGEPDVIFMVYDPANANPDTDNTVTEYDDGVAAQDAALSAEAQDVTAEIFPLASGLDAMDNYTIPKGGALAPDLRFKLEDKSKRPRDRVADVRHNDTTYEADAVLANIMDQGRNGPAYQNVVEQNRALMEDMVNRANLSISDRAAMLAAVDEHARQKARGSYRPMDQRMANQVMQDIARLEQEGLIDAATISSRTGFDRARAETILRKARAIAVQPPGLASGIDLLPRVQAALPKRGIAQPVEYKTPEIISRAVFDGAADPRGAFDNVLKWFGRAGRAAGRQVFNQQAGLKQIERLAGMDEASIHEGMSRMAQMMTASSGRVAAMMSFGAPRWNAQKKIYEIDRSTKGLDDIFKFNGVEDYQNFQGYAYAKRDRGLMKRGKGARMTDDLRNEYEAIPAADKARYDAMLDEYAKYNQALRQLMKDSGLISDAQMKALEADAEYVPMYRIFEDPEAIGLGGVFGNDGGFSHPDPGVKGMKVDAKKVGEPDGGEFGDLLESIHNNAVAVMHAASQNLAHQQIYNFMTTNLPHEVQRKVRAEALGKKEKKAARKYGDQDAVRFMQDGKEFYWRAKGEPEWTGALQIALAGLSPTQLDGIDLTLKKFNNFQRTVITSTPAFAIRSIIRDMGQAYVQSGTNPAAVAQKNSGMLRESFGAYSEATQALMMASGVAGYQMQAMPDVTAAGLRKKVGAQEAGRLHQIRTAFGAYERVLGSTELAARTAVYEGVLGKTSGDQAAAAYEALNMIDYSRKGASRAVQKMTYMVLFLNPRLQGLYRLFETTGGDAKTKYLAVSTSLAARGLMLMGLGLGFRALTAMDDEAEERYRSLTAADRATYFHVPIPGSDRFLRLPKPFEVGAVFATLPVAGIDAVATGPQGMDDLGTMAMHVFMETFSFNPTPQAIRPVAEVLLNRNMFTGREIEGMRLENLPKSERIDTQTTGIAQVISKYLTGSGVSPVMVQHLMQGYLGPLGMLAVDATDATLSGAGIVPDKAAKVEGIFGGLPAPVKIPTDFAARWLFSTTEGERGTRYIGDFYNLHSEIRQYTAAINEAKRVGDLDKVKELSDRAAPLMPMKTYLNRVSRQMTDLNQRMRVAQNSPNLSEAERQQRMAEINLKKNEIARKAIERAYELGVM